MGLCPFHGEKTPSFTVNQERQIFHCFGCGEGGNVIGFIMKREGLSFPEAVRFLAARRGISLPEYSPGRPEEKGLKERLLEANAAAAGLFKANLLGPSGRQALAYLERRSITAATREEFGIGWAVPGRDVALPRIGEEGLHPAGAAPGRPVGPARDRRGRRPLPRAGGLPDPRCRRQGGGLRRAPACGGRAEIPQFAGDAAVPQEQRPVRAAPGQGLHPPRGRRHHRRGVLRPDHRRPGRRGERGRDLRHRAHGRARGADAPVRRTLGGGLRRGRRGHPRGQAQPRGFRRARAVRARGAAARRRRPRQLHPRAGGGGLSRARREGRGSHGLLSAPHGPGAPPRHHRGEGDGRARDGAPARKGPRPRGAGRLSRPGGAAPRRQGGGPLVRGAGPRGQG